MLLHLLRQRLLHLLLLLWRWQLGSPKHWLTLRVMLQLELIGWLRWHLHLQRRSHQSRHLSTGRKLCSYRPHLYLAKPRAKLHQLMP